MTSSQARWLLCSMCLSHRLFCELFSRLASASTLLPAFLHHRCLLGKDEGCQKSNRLCVLHRVFSSSHCRSDHPRSAIHFSDPILAAPDHDYGAKRNHSCPVWPD